MQYYNFEETGKPEKGPNSTWNDRWIIELIYPGKTGGYFLEAGACGGIYGSCSYALEKFLDWKGICVEPIEDYYEKLIKNRPNSYCVNKCLSGDGKPVPFLHFTASKGNSTTYAHRVPSYHDKLMKDSPHEIIERPSTTLAALLTEANAPRLVDYMALDLNGAEFSVMEPFPFSEYRFGAISIEDNRCDKLLAANGYIKVSNPFTISPHECYYLHPDTAASLRTNPDLAEKIGLV